MSGLRSASVVRKAVRMFTKFSLRWGMNGQISAACFREMRLFAEREHHAKEVRMHLIFVQDLAYQNGTDLKRVYCPLRKHRSIVRQLYFHSCFVAIPHYSYGRSGRFFVDRSPQRIAIIVDSGIRNP